MPQGKKLFHAREYFNDVARNICVVFYLHNMEYSIKEILTHSNSCSQANAIDYTQFITIKSATPHMAWL
jgi:hypothetical protein